MARPKTRLDNAAATHACNTILRTSLSLFMPTVSVIIVNYNGEELLDDCLGSLGRQTYQDFEIVFVDNGSHDNSLVRAKELCPGIRCVKLQQNTGFTGANNEGFRHATGRFIVLLNNDTESDPHFLEELVLAAERRAEIGMVAPKILNFYDREEIDSVGGLVLCPDGIGQGRGRGEKDRAQYDGLDDILIPSGCAALYRRAMLDQVGLFDERFFAYCEDTDLGLRGRWAGWEAVSAPRSVVYHKYSGSSGAYSPFKMRLVERNHYLTAVKTLPFRSLLCLPIYSCYRYLLMAYAALTGKGKGRAPSKGPLLWALIMGHLQALAGTPGSLQRRWQSKKVKTSHHMYGLLKASQLDLKQMILNR